MAPLLYKNRVPERSKHLQDTQIIGILSALTLHMAFIIMFAVYKVHLLMWFNILISVPLFTIAFFLSLKGRLKLPPLLGTTEVAIHQVLAVLLIGQESGFHLLLFCLVLTGILYMKWKVALIANTVISFTLFLFLVWFDSGQFILYELPANTLRFIKSVNCLGMFTIVGFILFYYISLTQRLYHKLQKTIEKLHQSNEELNITVELVNEQSEEIQEKNRTLEYQKEQIELHRDELINTLEHLERTQYKLIESEKMSALGTLVAGIAHEINTPVGIGVTAVSNLIDETKQMEDLYHRNGISRNNFKEYLTATQNCATLIHKNLERTVSLIQSFKQVSVDQSSEQQRDFNMKSYLEDVVHSLSPRINGMDVAIDVDCDERLSFNSYPGAFAQIFTNLILNSIIHGFEEKNRGTICMKAVKNNGTLEIQYQDDGKGIQTDIMPKIFDPFITSDHSKGTGLGLYIVNNLVTQKLGGSIICDSKYGAGTRFLITIPLS